MVVTGAGPAGTEAGPGPGPCQPAPCPLRLDTDPPGRLRQWCSVLQQREELLLPGVGFAARSSLTPEPGSPDPAGASDTAESKFPGSGAHIAAQTVEDLEKRCYLRRTMPWAGWVS